MYLVQDNNSTASQSQTVLTNVQLDPGSAEYLQPVISNLTNITMLTSTLAVRPQHILCQSTQLC